MSLEETIKVQVKDAVKALYGIDADDKMIQLQKTRPEFEGNLTLVVFPFVKLARKAPAQVAQEIGEKLQGELVLRFNAVQGFLNMVISEAFWVRQLEAIAKDDNFGFVPVTESSKLMMVEYSSPNTNKPLHLGHVRNNLLGSSIARIQEANGWKVVKTNIVNDRGIHIFMWLLALLRFGNG